MAKGKLFIDKNLSNITNSKKKNPSFNRDFIEKIEIFFIQLVR